ncbi:MAG: hypothetical protein JNK87_16740 [Bryobacterales bacterium]|nr:hypothetical protein [Bryobacterales bacterium]
MQVQAAPCAAPAVYVELQKRAAMEPAVALACAATLAKPAARTHLERTAFLNLASRDPKAAKAFADLAAAAPWAGDVGLDAAIAIGDVRLVLAAARAQPHVALRDVVGLKLYAFGKQALDAAIEQAPGEAVAVASGSSPTAETLRAQLGGSSLGLLVGRGDIDLPTKQRMAWVRETLTAQEVRQDRLYLARLAELGFQGELRRAAEEVLADGKVPAGWSSADLFRLAVAGRAKVDRALYAKLFAAIGKPDAAWPGLREYTADAAVHGLAAKLPPTLLAHTMRGIDDVEQMILAGEIIDGAPAAALPEMAKALHEGGSAFQGLLGAHLAGRMPKGAEWAREYQRYLRAPASFQVPRRSVQRYHFYDDDDGWMSFRAFQATYRGDKRWRWVERDGVVTLTAQSKLRRIEIYANKPDAGRVTMPAKPDVIVHRGHEYHLYRTLRELDPNARLIYLGACRGAQYVETVLANANSAQMFATKGNGTVKVNDPLLKALNEQLLAAPAALNWTQFWGAQQRRFTGVSDFKDYIPPHKNTTAILLRAYYAYLAE